MKYLIIACLIVCSISVKISLKPLHNEKEYAEKSILFHLFSLFDGTEHEFIQKYSENAWVKKISSSKIRKYYQMYKNQPRRMRSVASSNHAVGFTPLGTPADYIYYCEAGLGTPVQNGFKFLFDTGSPLVWIPGVDCNAGQCLQKKRFNYLDSITFQNTSTPRSLQYATAGAGYLDGFMVIDYLNLGGFNVSQNFIDAYDMQLNDYNYQKIDGLIGLASEANNGNSFFQNLINDNLIENQLFSYYSTHDFTTAGSFIDFGNIDSTYYSGTLNYYPLNGLYSINSASIIVSGQVAVSQYNTIFDSGTTKIALGDNAADNVNSLIGNVNSDCSNISSLPDVIIQISGDNYPLSPNDYVAQYNPEFQAVCFSGFIPTGESGYIILGNFFFRKYFTVFDLGNSQIGIATAV